MIQVSLWFLATEIDIFRPWKVSSRIQRFSFSIGMRTQCRGAHLDWCFFRLSHFRVRSELVQSNSNYLPIVHPFPVPAVNRETLGNLHSIMTQKNQVGVINVSQGQGPPKMLVMVFNQKNRSFLALIPNDPEGFFTKLKEVYQIQKRPGQEGVKQQNPQQQQQQQQQTPQVSQQQQNPQQQMNQHQMNQANMQRPMVSMPMNTQVF